MNSNCLGYFITFSCYGARLLGAEEGSVHFRNKQFGTPLFPANPSASQIALKRQNEPVFEMNEADRAATLSAILEVCEHRHWEIFAAHARSNHVHSVIYAPDKPERVMRDFKSYATRRLRKITRNLDRTSFWSRHGSTRYLWKIKDVENAIHYTLHEQGSPMAIFKTDDEGNAMGRVIERISRFA